MNKGIGFVFLNLSVAIYLFATGILDITLRNRGEISTAVASLNIDPKSDFYRVLVIVISLLAIAAGVFILLKFFGISVDVIEKLLIVLAITWAIFILMIDIIPLFKNERINFVYFLKSFGYHVMALSGILLATERFGG